MRMQLLTHISFSPLGVCQKNIHTNNTLPLYRGIAEILAVWVIKTMDAIYEVHTPG